MKFLANFRARKPAPADTAYVSERHGVRTLHIGSDTVQSAMRLARPYDLELSYTRSMMAFLLFVPKPARMLMVGLGGGSLAKFVHRKMHATRVTAIEVSAQVVAIARHYFYLPADDERLEVIVANGADYMTRRAESADVIALDGYSADTHAEELTTEIFYSTCRERLRAGGMLVVNLWSGDKLFSTLLHRIQAAFPTGSLCLPAERPGNVIVLAFRERPEPVQWTLLNERAAALEDDLGLEFTRFTEGLRKMNRHDRTHLFP